MALSIDGTASIYGTSGTSFSTGTLACSNAGNVICVAITINVGGTVVTSVSGTGATFTKRATSQNAANNINRIEFWVGFASGIFNSVITITASGSGASFATVHAYGISGAPSSSFFDVNASCPDVDVANDGVATISTSNANDILLGFARMVSVANPTAMSGFTRILGATGNGYTLTEYKIVSATQTNIGITDGDGNNGGIIGDAVIDGGGGGGTNTIRNFAVMFG